MNIVVLDACRDNPFGSGSQDRQRAQDGCAGRYLPRLCNGPGNVAADGSGKHGLYTENILREMRAPDAKIEDVFKRVHLSVRRSSAGQQIPWRAPSLEEDFYFKPPANLRKRSEEELLKLFEDEQKLWKPAEDASDPDRYSPTWSIIRRAFLRVCPGETRPHARTAGLKRIRLADATHNPFTKGTRAIRSSVSVISTNTALSIC